MDFLVTIWLIILVIIVMFLILLRPKERRSRDDLEARPRITPAPSYKNFAPPSYESAVNKENIFIIPIIREGNYIEDIRQNNSDSINRQ